jgi:hypothetical protein
VRDRDADFRETTSFNMCIFPRTLKNRRDCPVSVDHDLTWRLLEAVNRILPSGLNARDVMGSESCMGKEEERRCSQSRGGGRGVGENN